MGLSVLCVKLVKKIGGQRYNILFALTQWRDGQFKDIQTIVEIRSEFIAFDELCQVLIVLGDNFDIDLHRSGGTDGQNFFLLNGTEQLRLSRKRQL